MINSLHFRPNFRFSSSLHFWYIVEDVAGSPRARAVLVPGDGSHLAATVGRGRRGAEEAKGARRLLRIEGQSDKPGDAALGARGPTAHAGRGTQQGPAEWTH